MRGVAVRIFHASPAASAGPLTRELAAARLSLAERHVAAFRRIGATDVAIVAGAPDDTRFGARLRALVAEERPAGILVMGSGALALARQMYDSRDFAPMPVLADALQDAGCEHVGVLAHCRGDGPHVRGCWVVDLLLGKE